MSHKSEEESSQHMKSNIDNEYRERAVGRKSSNFKDAHGTKI